MTRSPAAVLVGHFVNIAVMVSIGYGLHVATGWALAALGVIVVLLLLVAYRESQKVRP